MKQCGIFQMNSLLFYFVTYPSVMSVHLGNYQHKDIEFKLTWFTQKFILLYKSLVEQNLYAKIKSCY